MLPPGHTLTVTDGTGVRSPSATGTSSFDPTSRLTEDECGRASSSGFSTRP